MPVHVGISCKICEKVYFFEKDDCSKFKNPVQALQINTLLFQPIGHCASRRMPTVRQEEPSAQLSRNGASGMALHSRLFGPRSECDTPSHKHN
jgi:hypothetical protein